MRYFFTYFLFWAAVAAGTVLLYFLFKEVLRVPLGMVIAAALIITWILPQPWRFLVPLAVLAEVITITPPLALTAALLSPLLLWWLRGRTEVDVSFSYTILIAASAALALTLVVGVSTYPWWSRLPWLTIVFAWLAIAGTALAGTILLPSIHSRLFHGRYF